jgi:hypothetical protein
MVDLISFFNNNTGILTVISSLILAVITAIYVYLTHNLVSETKKMREFQSDPEILVTIQPKEDYMWFIYLNIINLGGGSAHDIKFKLSPDLECYDGQYLSKVGIIKEGLNALGPNQDIKFLLTDIPYLTEKKRFLTLELDVSYRNMLDKKFKRHYSLNFSQFKGISHMPNHYLIPNIQKIGDQLEEIKKIYSKK